MSENYLDNRISSGKKYWGKTYKEKKMNVTLNASLMSDECDMDPYDQAPLVECFQLKIMTAYLLVIFVASLCLNSALLAVFCRFNDLRITAKTFLIAITALNIFATFGNLPLTIISNFYCKLDLILLFDLTLIES
jgi:hypothetical protein